MRTQRRHTQGMRFITGPARQREWVEQFYPAIFFESRKSIKVLAWLAGYKGEIPRRAMAEVAYQATFWPLHHPPPPPPPAFGAPQIIVPLRGTFGMTRHIAGYQCSAWPATFANPKFGAKTEVEE